jgi:single-strand DNA-binding protein
MDTMISLAGTVVTEPRSTVDRRGQPVVHFRMLAVSRRFEPSTQQWVDKDKLWVGVTCFRQLAKNAGESIQFRDRILVIGRLRTREWADEDGQTRTSTDMTAEALGHDLNWGTSEFTRPVPDAPDGQSEADELARSIEEDSRAARPAGEEDFLVPDRTEDSEFGRTKQAETVPG